MTKFAVPRRDFGIAVGRVGALAVALGVGVVIASGPGAPAPTRQAQRARRQRRARVVRPASGATKTDEGEDNAAKGGSSSMSVTATPGSHTP
jgi:hypothetical protein